MPGPLVHSPADVLRYTLVSLGVGTLPSVNGNWPIFATNEPETPDELITLYDTMPWVRGRSQPDGEVQEHHGVQVRVRAGHPALGFKKCWEVAQALDLQVHHLNVTVPIQTIGFGINAQTVPAANYHVWAISRHARNRQGASGFLYLGKERSQTVANDITTQSARDIFSLNTLVSLRMV